MRYLQRILQHFAYFSLWENLKMIRNGVLRVTFKVWCPRRTRTLITQTITYHLGMQRGVQVGAEKYGLSLSEKLLSQYLNEQGYVSHTVGKVLHCNVPNVKQYPAKNLESNLKVQQNSYRS